MTASRYERSRKLKRQSRKVEDSKEVIRRRKSRRTDNAMTKTTGKKQSSYLEAVIVLSAWRGVLDTTLCDKVCQ
jgi:uncharacterized protein (DUF849 family)